MCKLHLSLVGSMIRLGLDEELPLSLWQSEALNHYPILTTDQLDAMVFLRMNATVWCRYCCFFITSIQTQTQSSLWRLYWWAESGFSLLTVFLTSFIPELIITSQRMLWFVIKSSLYIVDNYVAKLIKIDCIPRWIIIHLLLVQIWREELSFSAKRDTSRSLCERFQLVD